MMNLCAIRIVADPVFETAIAFFKRGGIVMWPLLACSLVAMAQAIERILCYTRERTADRLQAKKVKQIFSSLAECNFE